MSHASICEAVLAVGDVAKPTAAADDASSNVHQGLCARGACANAMAAAPPVAHGWAQHVVVCCPALGGSPRPPVGFKHVWFRDLFGAFICLLMGEKIRHDVLTPEMNFHSSVSGGHNSLNIWRPLGKRLDSFVAMLTGVWLASSHLLLRKWRWPRTNLFAESVLQVSKKRPVLLHCATPNSVLAKSTSLDVAAPNQAVWPAHRHHDALMAWPQSGTPLPPLYLVPRRAAAREARPVLAWPREPPLDATGHLDLRRRHSV